MANTLEAWYASVPTVTRAYLTITLVVTVGCALEVRPGAERGDSIDACLGAASTRCASAANGDVACVGDASR